jgi:hypothetical protein
LTEPAYERKSNDCGAFWNRTEPQEREERTELKKKFWVDALTHTSGGRKPTLTPRNPR